MIKEGTVFRFMGVYETIDEFTSTHKTRHGDFIGILDEGFYFNNCGAFQYLDVNKMMQGMERH